jgi:hypothetical protein
LWRIILLAHNSVGNACHVKATTGWERKTLSKIWVWALGREWKTERQIGTANGGGRTDFIFLTHWDRFQQINDEQKVKKKKKSLKEGGVVCVLITDKTPAKPSVRTFSNTLQLYC